jgi:hypothetical protein
MCMTTRRRRVSPFACFAAAALITGASFLLSGCAAVSAAPADAAASTPATPQTGPPEASTPVPTMTVVDPAGFPIDMGGNSGAPLLGVSFDAPNPNMHCGIYTNWWTDVTDHNVRGLMFGCRMEQGYTFTYPPIVNKPPIGGCPSGFTVIEDQAPEVLCNSGQVFASEIETANTLKTGQRLVDAGVQCDGLDDGVRCVNLTSTHGFTLTPSAYTLF